MKTQLETIAAGALLGMVLLGAADAAATVQSPTGVKAAVHTGDDTKINLTWNNVSGATGYYVYRVRSAPIQTNATASVLYGTWTNPERAIDGDYYLSASVMQPAPSTNVSLLLTFPSARYIGAVGFLTGCHDGNPVYVTLNYSLIVGTNVLANNAACPWPRNGMTSHEFRPINTTTVQLDIGNWTDGSAGIAEIDIWEYERMASVAVTNWQDSGLTIGKSYTYYVTAYDGSGESTNLSNRASLRAGDRDDTNSTDSIVSPPVATDTAGPRTGYTPGSFEAWTALGNPPNAPTGLRLKGPLLKWDASLTEAGSGDVKRYRIFRTYGDVTTNVIQIQTNALPANGGSGVLTKFDFVAANSVPSTRAINAIDGDTNTVALTAGGNYGEAWSQINFGSGRFFAMRGMRVYQGGPNFNSSAWNFRGLYLESMGLRWPSTGRVNLDGTGGDPYVFHAFNAGDSLGWADFDFKPVASTVTNWMIGDNLILHLEKGEGWTATEEFAIYGTPQLQSLATVTAAGAPSYTFADPTAQSLATYTYFVVAEDYAGNFSMPCVAPLRYPIMGLVLTVR